MKAFLRYGTAVVIGVLLGGFSVFFISASYINKYSEDVEAANIGAAVTILRALRSGNTQQGYDVLETRLNGSIIMFINSTPHTKEGSNAVLRAKNYRKQYPFKSGYTNVDDVVSEVLSQSGD